MRIYILFIFFTLLTIFSCNNKDVYFSYGGQIDLTDKSLFVSSIDNNYNISNIEGQIIDVCPKKGCCNSRRV